MEEFEIKDIKCYTILADSEQDAINRYVSWRKDEIDREYDPRKETDFSAHISEQYCTARRLLNVS